MERNVEYFLYEIEAALTEWKLRKVTGQEAIKNIDNLIHTHRTIEGLESIGVDVNDLIQHHHQPWVSGD